MFGIRIVSVSLSLALAASSATAQTRQVFPAQAPVAAPAGATLGRIVAIENADPVSSRGQLAEPRIQPTIIPARGPSVPPTFVNAQNPGVPMPGTPMPATPMAVAPGSPSGPGVTELRSATTPGVTFGQAAPMGGSPTPVAGHPYPASGPAMNVAPTPVVGGYPGIPVHTAPTAVVGDGYMAQPILSDAYLGEGTALFPRVRNAVGRVVGGPLSGRLTLEADYLLWFIRAQGAPALVTTSSPANNGIIGQGDTRMLYGDDVLGNTRFSGARFGATYWFPNSCYGLDGNIFFLGRNGGNFVADSSTNPLLARPFVRADTGAQFSQIFASPVLASGSVAVTHETSMFGADVNIRRPLFCGACSRIDGLLGFRTVTLEESLNVTESFTRLPGAATNFAAGVIEDRFRTENHFYGVNLGLAGELRRGRFYTSFRGSVGLGSVYQELQVNGSQNLVTTAGQQLRAEGGLLALPGANIGSYHQRKFGVVPEANLTLGVYLTQHLRFGVGYNFLYMNSVLRPADQIDTTVDVTRIPNFLVPGATAVNPARPRVYPLKTTDMFAQGITFSLQYTW